MKDVADAAAIQTTPLDIAASKDALADAVDGDGATGRLRGVQIRFLECGEPVGDANTQLKWNEEVVFSGNTDANGTINADLASRIDEMIAVIDAPTGKRTASVRAQAGRTVDVNLSSNGWVRGVVAGGGSLPTSGVRVIAIPDSVSRRPASSQSILSSAATRMGVVTNSGEYSICDLPAGDIFNLVAVGDGRVSTITRRIIATAEGTRVDLALVPVYVCLVHVADASGQPIHLPKRAVEDYALGGVTFQAPVGFRAFSPNQECLLALGIPEEYLTRRVDYNLACFVAGSEDAHPQFIEIEAGFYGYESTRTEAKLQIASYAIEVAEIRLARLSRDVGSIRVHVTNSDCALNEGQAGKLVLRRIGTGPPASISLGLDATRSDTTLAFDEIQAGRYRAFIEADTKGFRFPTKEEGFLDLTVGDHPAEIDLDLAGTTCVNLIATRPDGVAYAGPMIVYLHADSGSPHSARALSFEMGPYWLLWMQQGQYRAKIQIPGLSWHCEVMWEVERGRPASVQAILEP